MAQKKSTPATAKANARGSKPIVAPPVAPPVGRKAAASARPTPSRSPAKAPLSAPGNGAAGKVATGKVVAGKGTVSKAAPAAPAHKGKPVSASAGAKGKVVPQSAAGADPKKTGPKGLKSDAMAPKTSAMSSAAPAKKDRSTSKTPAAAKGSGKSGSKPAEGSNGAKKPAAAKDAGQNPKTGAKADAKATSAKGAAKAAAGAKNNDVKNSGAKNKPAKGGRPEPELEATAAAEGEEPVEAEQEALSESDAKEAEELDPVLKLKIPEIEEPKAARVSIKPKNPDRPTLEELRQMPTEDIWGYYRRAATAATRDEKYIEEMRNVLMELHLPLVKHIAERLLQTLPKSIELGDLESAGAFGLMDAIRGFDPDRGIKFKTYCTTRIRGSILDMLRSQDWVPRLVRLKASRIEKTLQRLQGEYGREPTHAELASALDMDHAALSVELSQSRAKTMYSLSERWDDRDDDSGGEKIEIVEDQKAVDPVFELNRRDLMLHITKSLSHKERFIIEQYYDVGHTMREIGEMLALTESRVCQIHSNVMARLKDLLNPGSTNLES
jgi:RNA polymerase sigma factor for flagellar operon FliA